MPSLLSIVRPAVLAAPSMLRARPAPYVVLSSHSVAVLQPSFFMTETSAAPWILSRGTTRAYVRLPVG